VNFNGEFFKGVLGEILAIDSPTGFTKAAVAKVKEIVDGMGYETSVTKKGNLIVSVKGKSDRTVGISAHIDTLGLVVRGYRGDGTLTFSKVGGSILPTLDGEYCKVYTRWGKVYTGTILSNSPSSHVYTDAGSVARDDKNMHVKLDVETDSKEQTQKLDILPGDFICYEPKTVFTDTGFLKSRFLDDKMSVSIILALLKHFKDNNITPEHNVCVIFSTYEEVGHGMAHLPVEVDEFVAVDMGCIGDDLSCTEFDVSICAKDSSGPYDYELTTRLIDLAKGANLNFAVDIYPMYGSDVSAAQRAGNDMKGALIGPGVAASHGMERSHIKAAENTWKLLHLYLAK